MTITTPPDVERARDLNCLRETYRVFHDWQTRPDFGTFAINFLRERGLELVPAPEPLPCCATMPDGRHSPYCPQHCDTCRGDASGPDRCRCNDGKTLSERLDDVLSAKAVEMAELHAEEPADLPPGELLADFLATLHQSLPDSPHLEQAVQMTVPQVADLLAALAEHDLRWIPGEGDQCGTLLDGAAEPPDLHVVFDAFRNVWQRDDDRAATLGDPCQRWFNGYGTSEPWASLQRVNGPMTPDGGIAPTRAGVAS